MECPVDANIRNSVFIEGGIAQGRPWIVESLDTGLLTEIGDE